MARPRSHELAVPGRSRPGPPRGAHAGRRSPRGGPRRSSGPRHPAAWRQRRHDARADAARHPHRARTGDAGADARRHRLHRMRARPAAGHAAGSRAGPGRGREADRGPRRARHRDAHRRPHRRPGHRPADRGPRAGRRIPRRRLRVAPRNPAPPPALVPRDAADGDRRVHLGRPVRVLHRREGRAPTALLHGPDRRRRGARVLASGRACRASRATCSAWAPRVWAR